MYSWLPSKFTFQCIFQTLYIYVQYVVYMTIVKLININFYSMNPSGNLLVEAVLFYTCNGRSNMTDNTERVSLGSLGGEYMCSQYTP